jgi:hypothetical protein
MVNGKSYDNPALPHAMRNNRGKIIKNSIMVIHPALNDSILPSSLGWQVTLLKGVSSLLGIP